MTCVNAIKDVLSFWSFRFGPFVLVLSFWSFRFRLSAHMCAHTYACLRSLSLSLSRTPSSHSLLALPPRTPSSHSLLALPPRTPSSHSLLAPIALSLAPLAAALSCCQQQQKKTSNLFPAISNTLSFSRALFPVPVSISDHAKG
jgi:hypothetical protein